MPRRKGIAMLFGCPEETVRQWELAEGMPVRSDGRYDLVEVVRWRLDVLLDRAGESREKAGPNLQQEKLRQEIRQRKVKADAAEGQVLPRQDVIDAHRELVTLISSRLEEVPAQAASTCPPEVADRVQAIVEDAISAARKDLAASAYE